MALRNSLSFSSADGLISPNSSSASGTSTSARTSISAEEASEDRLKVSSPWSFEGQELQQDRHKRNGQGPKPSSNNASRCLAGCAADCTALCCCCPLMVFHILAVFCVKFPRTVFSRARKAAIRHRSKKRMKKAMSDAADEAWTTTSPLATPCSSSREPRLSPMPVSGCGFGDQRFWSHFDSCSSTNSSLTSPHQ